MTDTQEIRSALSYIPPIDRDEWVRMAMAVKSELGEAGFDIWNDWSQRDERSYRANDARAVWKSVKAYGGTTIRTLFAAAIRNGWEPSQRTIVERPALPRRKTQEDIEEARRDREQRAAAARTAQDIISKCQVGRHPYLVAKGLPQEERLLDYDGRLVIPMRSVLDYRQITSLQWIASDGTKKFLPKGTTKGSAFMIGSGSETWFVEGFATGLSVHAALKLLYRTVRVCVCFSAGNLAHVAGLLRGPRYVVADNDESDTGRKCAVSTGLPWVMPPTVGDDANDMHMRSGLPALAHLLRGMVM
ncbi:hypothetical protein CAL29_28165 [Bordetella genomosp. 10]|uniref:Primase C-terminal 2 domain-containing protein n=1 Tax=Bordetella genomosp. 10 TaxID=1416804 RepID=A0A261S325_9BORD|nr:PriCT-2 domain-containing protein [Bordetella genomosp. 10]OZI31749.1 hypothetical protein CAL29_28165 [Bordetella genomosp. 10]